jgi:hypothetical protein
VSRTEFFPYPFAAGALELGYEVRSAEVTVGETGRVLATETPESDSIDLDLEVRAEDGTFDLVLPQEERPSPPVAALVAMRSITSRTRQAITLDAVDGLWRGTLSVPKRDAFGEIELQPMLVRTATGPVDGYAAHEGALIADGEAVLLEVDEPPTPAGGFLEIKFDNFRETGNPRRADNPDLLYMLDTDSDPPILWLNEGVDEFKSIMLAKGPRGYNLRIRDAMFDTIVSQVWTSLAAIAITNLALVIVEQKEADDDSDPVDALPSEWQQRVLSFWAPHVFGGTKAEALEQIVGMASEKGLLPYLIDQFGIAVQKWAGTEKAFRVCCVCATGRGSDGQRPAAC